MCKEEVQGAQALGAGSWDRLHFERDLGESSPWPVGHPSPPFQAFFRASLEQDGQELPSSRCQLMPGFP